MSYASLHTIETDGPHAEFERDTSVSPQEWERRWKTEEIEDRAENMRLTIRALTLRLAEQQKPTRQSRGGKPRQRARQRESLSG